MIAIFLFGVFPALMAFAAAYDLTTMTIPNRLTAAVGLAFIAVILLVGPPLSAPADAGAPSLGAQAARAGDRHPLRDRARYRGSRDLAACADHAARLPALTGPFRDS